MNQPRTARRLHATDSEGPMNVRKFRTNITNEQGRKKARQLRYEQIDHAQEGVERWKLVPGQQAVINPVYSRSRLKIVALGGGTGLPVVLRGIKAHLFKGGSPGRTNETGGTLTAVVTVADDGGSSGLLRKDFQVLPPGDIRNCLVALSDHEERMAELFQYRFSGSRGLDGHAMGNLLLVAISHLTKDFLEALRYAEEVLAVTGSILPSTLSQVHLHATFEDGSEVKGESSIAGRRGKIATVRLDPPTAEPVPETLAAIGEADVIIMGPGSLYTSIIPNLLVRGVPDAIRASRARKIFVSNLMTEPGETDGYSVADHLKAVIQHAGEGLIQHVLVNTEPLQSAMMERYAAEGSLSVKYNKNDVMTLGINPVEVNVLAEGDVVRHNSDKLAWAILDTATE